MQSEHVESMPRPRRPARPPAGLHAIEERHLLDIQGFDRGEYERDQVDEDDERERVLEVLRVGLAAGVQGTGQIAWGDRRAGRPGRAAWAYLRPESML